MSRLSVFAALAVLSALTATPVAFAKEHHHVGKAPQSASEQVRNAHAAVSTLPERPSDYWPNGYSSADHLLGQSSM